MNSFTDRYSTHPRVAFAPPFPAYSEAVVLPADTLVRIPIPVIPGVKVRYVGASFMDHFWSKVGVVGTALIIPNATTTDGSAGELNLAYRAIPDFLDDNTTVPTHICLRAATACVGSLAFYRE